jgi:hypothetical protein
LLGYIIEELKIQLNPKKIVIVYFLTNIYAPGPFKETPEQIVRNIDFLSGDKTLFAKPDIKGRYSCHHKKCNQIKELLEIIQTINESNGKNP